MRTQSTIERSATSTAAAALRALIVNPTPGLATASKTPNATEPLMLDLVKLNLVFAVTDVFTTTEVPRASVAWPILALAPALSDSPFPAALNSKLPFVNVALPKVRVSVPELNRTLPEVRVRLPEVRVAFPDVRARFPDERVSAPVVRVSPPAPFGVKVKPTAAFVPVPVKTLPLPRVIAVAAVAVVNVVAVMVVKVDETEPNVVQVATPPANAPSAKMFPLVLFTQGCPSG